MKELRQVNRRTGWWQWLAGLGRGFRRNQNPVTDHEVIKGLNITLYKGQCFEIVVSSPTYPTLQGSPATDMLFVRNLTYSRNLENLFSEHHSNFY